MLVSKSWIHEREYSLNCSRRWLHLKNALYSGCQLQQVAVSLLQCYEDGISLMNSLLQLHFHRHKKMRHYDLNTLIEHSQQFFSDCSFRISWSFCTIFSSNVWCSTFMKLALMLLENLWILSNYSQRSLFLILFTTYYSKNYSSIMYACLISCHKISLKNQLDIYFVTSRVFQLFSGMGRDGTFLENTIKLFYRTGQNI